MSGEWVSSDEEALILTADRPLYLRAATYDEYTGLGFRWSDSDKRSVESGDLLFAGTTSELPTIEESVVAARIAIEMRQTIGNDLFTAGSPVVIDAPSVVVQTNGAPVLAGTEHETPLSEGERYELEIALSRANQAELGTAGRDYPPEVSELYLDTTGITDRVAQLAEDVIEQAGAENDYERAEALAGYLRLDESFTYSTKAEMPGNGQDFVDFFLFDPRADRTGYCEYYATAMALMARSVGLPARVAVGFAPGERLEEGTYLYRESNAHAWVEIYFPGYGWQIFEATHTIRGVFRASGDPSVVAPPIGTATDPIDWNRFIEEGGGIIPLPSQGEVVGAPTDQGDDGRAERAG